MYQKQGARKQFCLITSAWRLTFYTNSSTNRYIMLGIKYDHMHRLIRLIPLVEHRDEISNQPANSDECSSKLKFQMTYCSLPTLPGWLGTAICLLVECERQSDLH